MAPDSVAPPELPSAGQSQKDAWVGQRGEGGVEVLLQVLLQPALLRKLFLKEEDRSRDCGCSRDCGHVACLWRAVPLREPLRPRSDTGINRS